MNYKNDIEKLEKELKEAKTRQSNLERNCNHQWEEVKYDPEKYMEEYCTGEYDIQGIHMWPKTSFKESYKQRWSRKCNKCGKIEYTYEQKAVKYEPKF